MSIINEALAPCSKCGQQHKIVIYKSINISDNPELKDKVKDGSLFLWECPHCGQVNLAKYETLYHDPQKKLMVWLIPSGEISEAQMQAITMHTKAMGGYTLRRVNDMGSLMEKVLIADAELDDVVLEMCKFVTKMEMVQKSVGQEKREEFMAPTSTSPSVVWATQAWAATMAKRASASSHTAAPWWPQAHGSTSPSATCPTRCSAS